MMSRLKLKVYMRYSIEYYIFINMVVVGGLVTKSCLTLVTPGTVACQTPLSMGFSRQECWDELPFPSPVDHPDPGIEPRSPALQAGSLPTEPPGKPKCVYRHIYGTLILFLWYMIYVIPHISYSQISGHVWIY